MKSEGLKVTPATCRLSTGLIDAQSSVNQAGRQIYVADWRRAEIGYTQDYRFMDFTEVADWRRAEIGYTNR